LNGTGRGRFHYISRRAMACVRDEMAWGRLGAHGHGEARRVYSGGYGRTAADVACRSCAAGDEWSRPGGRDSVVAGECIVLLVECCVYMYGRVAAGRDARESVCCGRRASGRR
jgi:hypothetical protein